MSIVQFIFPDGTSDHATVADIPRIGEQVITKVGEGFRVRDVAYRPFGGIDHMTRLWLEAT